MKSFLRGVIYFLVTGVCFALFAWVLARGVRGTVPGKAAVFDAKKTGEALALRDVEFDKDPTKLPTPYKDVHVTPVRESPLLTQLVEKGIIPPLKERMPENPVVMEGPEGIGNYGGTWLRLVGVEADIGMSIGWRLAGASLLRWSPLGYPIKPYIAESVEPSEGMKVWTVTLRKGMRWSNGDPYTADDIMFWWERDVHNSMDKEIVIPEWLRINGKEPVIEKIDDYHVRFTFAGPNALFREALCFHREASGVPSRYLSQYYPDPKAGISSQTVIDRDLKGYKQPSARALYGYMRSGFNTDLPTLAAYIYKTYRSRPPQVVVRNPFYFAVDTAGNQLPYIDRIQYDSREDPRIMVLSTANGDASMQDRNVDFTGYTEYMSRRESSKTTVLHWYPATRQLWVVNVNQNRKISDAATKWKEQLLSDKTFRQAMSLALNRKQINDAEYFGLGTPSQVSPGSMSEFDNPDLAKKYTQFDPGRANKMLDDLNLTRRDYEGYRTFPDGSRMTFFIDYCQFTGEGPMQFLIDDWKGVGVRVIRRMLTRGIFYSYYIAGDFDFNVWTSESDFAPLLAPWPNYFIASHSFLAPAWSRWYDQSGMYGDERASRVGIDPGTTANGKPMREAMEFYEKALHAPDKRDQIKYFREVEAISTEQLWTIGLVTAPPALAVISNDLANVPPRALVGATFSNPANAGFETWFFRHPQVNPSADAELVESFVHPLNRPGSSDGAEVHTSWTAYVLRFGFLGIGLLGAMMIFLKHPLVLRRIVILIPTLIIISVVVYTIVQLPPTDFLTSHRQALEADNAPSIDSQLDDLRRQFHTDEPGWKNYLRWTGALWFVTYSPSDEGLLQGNLGRSMESQALVNDIIGDRISLTILLSFGTMIFTWMLALPIGIYSATRQYKTSDYVMTLLGFLGMSVPEFLLALVLMAFFGVTGLFSPEFATQPGWSFAKFVDLMEHLWVPVLVMAIGGTAGMIRVMRANLLDELKKPYVTTARAKGVRPMKLLLKYPVRIALNPFVSGIGHLFPALISGGSIVAIVLSLPMVGPVLLNALFAQDLYLAGSMLMILSVLGVLGTLISDLLLLWIDPRIRFDAGSR